MSNINDLLGGDLDEEIDEILDDDDMDAILGSPSESAGHELDGILGGIGDEYLNDDEKVFLQNKNFLADTPTGQLDAHFLQMQEEMYSELENTLEDFSLGSVSDDDEFGADPDDDEFDEMERDLDSLEFDESDEFGSAADRLRRRRRRQSRRSGRKSARQSRRSTRQSRRSARKSTRQSRRSVRRAGRSSKRSEAIVATRRRYIRLAKQLEKSCKGFKRIGGSVNPKQVIALSAAPHMLVKRPFTTMRKMATAPFTALSAHLAGDSDDQFGGILSDDEFGSVLGLSAAALALRRLTPAQRRRRAAERRRRQSRRSGRAQTRRMKRMQRGSGRCDAKYQRLIKVWNRLRRRGKTSGLKSPQQIVGASSGWVKRISNKARRKVVLTPRESQAMQRARLRSRRQIELNRRRRQAATLASAKARKKRAEMQKIRIAKAKVSASSEYADLSAMTSYVDEADRKALQRAAVQRATKPVRMLPRPMHVPALSSSGLVRKLQLAKIAHPAAYSKKRVHLPRPVVRPRVVRPRVVRPVVRPVVRRRVVRPPPHLYSKKPRPVVVKRPIRTIARPTGLSISRPVPSRPTVRSMKPSKALYSKFKGELHKLMMLMRSAEKKLKSVLAHHKKAAVAHKSAVKRKLPSQVKYAAEMKRQAIAMNQLKSEIASHNIKIKILRQKAASQGIKI